MYVCVCLYCVNVGKCFATFRANKWTKTKMLRWINILLNKNGKIEVMQKKRGVSLIVFTPFHSQPYSSCFCKTLLLVNGFINALAWDNDVPENTGPLKFSINYIPSKTYTSKQPPYPKWYIHWLTNHMIFTAARFRYMFWKMENKLMENKQN